jgi:LCP family protein required for cell wall assembly
MSLVNNIETADVEAIFERAGIDRQEAVPVEELADPDAPAPMNILLLGSDSRAGDNRGFAEFEGGARSDTSIILHVSGDRSRVDFVSIPRDTTTSIPSCVAANGRQTRAVTNSRFGHAFAYGRAAGGDDVSGGMCAMQTIEQRTGIRFDGFVVIDFSGFARMVDSLGGVEIYIPNRIHAPYADDLRLNAGLQTLDGRTALQYARARTGVGLPGGSDIARMERQQQLLGAIIRTALDQNLLTDAPALMRFLTATTDSVAMNSSLASVGGLMDLASSMRGLGAEDMTFIMVPGRTGPRRPAQVMFPDDADALWQALRIGAPLPTP